MMQLKNPTPLATHFSLLPDENGVDTVFVVVKATWSLAPRVGLADEQVPVALADVYWSDPGASSVRYGSEMHLRKPSTDVVLVGAAIAPSGRSVPTLDVEMSVAERRKTVRVFGDREWKSGAGGVSATPPKPFESMPLVYERAFGGIFADPAKGDVLAEERNPVGVGFAGRRKDAEMVGSPLPNLEDPAALIRSPRDAPSPAGLGFVAPSWLPRRSFAGTYDDAWQQGRAPYLPKDFDVRYFNAAPPEFVFDRHLAGGESISVTNVSGSGALRFTIPSLNPSVAIRIEGSRQTPPLLLETVLIEPDLQRFCLTWRSWLACDKKALRVEEIAIDAPGLAMAERPH